MAPEMWEQGSSTNTYLVKTEIAERNIFNWWVHKPTNETLNTRKTETANHICQWETHLIEKIDLFKNID
jgi:hypothetical protein